MKLFTPLIAIACIASTVSADAYAELSCYGPCYADAAACCSKYSKAGDTSGSILTGVQTDSTGGQTVEEPVRLEFRGLRALALQGCNNAFVLCFMACALESGHI